MPRTKPTKATDVIGHFNLSPESCVGDYIESQQQHQFSVKPPNWDCAGESLELIYLANLRENESMVAMQKDLLANAKRQTDINFQRMLKMHKMQDRLRRRFIEVNGFIKECVDKKAVAQKEIDHEIQQHKELRKGIDEFKESIATLKTFRDDLKATVKQFNPYSHVLDEVVKASDIFVSPKDCMDRCDALMLAQVEINQLEQEKIQELEDTRKKMIQITSDAANTVLALKTDLSLLERSYNESRTLCYKWEKILSKCKNIIVNNDVEKERTLGGAHVLYRLLARRNAVDAYIIRENIEGEMDFIKSEMDILKALLKQMEEKKSKKGKTYITRKGC